MKAIIVSLGLVLAMPAFAADDEDLSQRLHREAIERQNHNDMRAIAEELRELRIQQQMDEPLLK